MKLRFATAALAACLWLSIAGASKAAPANVKISIDNFSFGAMRVTVPVGTTVTWINNDDIPHTVRAVNGLFHSKPLDTIDTYSFTFIKAGVYDYFCSIHPQMTAQVVVKGP